MADILTNEQIEDEWESVTGYRINKYKYFKEVDTAHLMEFASRLLLKAQAQERLEMTDREKIDAVLLAMMGSMEWVNKWWAAQNYAFDLRTPEQVFAEEPKRVVKYVLGHAFK